jgi:hypothetical protein
MLLTFQDRAAGLRSFPHLSEQAPGGWAPTAIENEHIFFPIMVEYDFFLF